MSGDWERVRKAIAARDAAAVAGLLLDLDEAGRRALVPELKRYRGEVDTDWRRSGEGCALRIAAAGCLPRAGEVVSWLRSGSGFHLEPPDVQLVVAVLTAPGRPSLAAVARDFAAKWRGNGGVDRHWSLAEALLIAADLEPPDNPAFLLGWMRQRERLHSSPAALADALAADPWTSVLIARLFDTDRAGEGLIGAWPAALAALCDSGRIDRGPVLSGCLRALRAGGRPGAVRNVLAVHQQLVPALDDFAAHRQEYLGVLSSPFVPAAAAAQTALLALDDAGRLPIQALAEAGQVILLRPDKKLVRAQLVHLDRAARKRPDDLAAILGSIAVGLGHESVDLAERALAVVAKHLAKADESTRAVLRQAATALTADLRRQADELLDLEPAPGPPTPPPTVVADLPASRLAPVASMGELVADASRLLHDQTDPVLFERALDGFVRYARTDRDGMRAALASLPVPGWTDSLSNTLRAAAGLPQLLPAARSFEPAPLPPTQLLHNRLTELATQLEQSPPAGLLATPATQEGLVDPDRVVSLLEQADQDRWQPGPSDLCQALLRLPREVDPAVRSRAARLGSPAGRTLHRWLVHGGLADPVVRKVIARVPECTHGPGPYYNNYRCWCADLPSGRVTVEVLPQPHEPIHVPAHLLDLPGGEAAYQRCYGLRPWSPAIEWWPMIFPSHRELIAAHIQPNLTSVGDSDRAGDTHVLPSLARCAGPFGFAMALCLAYGLAAKRDRERLPAIDAAVWLSLRGELDGALLGRELAGLVAADLIVLNRVVRGLAEFARGAEHRDLWAIIAAMLPAVLGQPTPPPGTPDLLALAETAASAIGVHTDLPELAALAARPGASRLVTEARRLARTLSTR